jgi:hypothetical protein
MAYREIATINLPPLELVQGGSWGERSVGEHASTMTLSVDEPDKTYLNLEWDIPSLDEVIEIGLTFEGKVLVDYDGVMALPAEAVKFLRDQGFTVPAEFE